MGFRRIYVLTRYEDEPTKVYHREAFGGVGFGNIEAPSFTRRFNIIAMDEKTVTVQKKNGTV